MGIPIEIPKSKCCNAKMFVNYKDADLHRGIRNIDFIYCSKCLRILDDRFNGTEQIFYPKNVLRQDHTKNQTMSKLIIIKSDTLIEIFKAEKMESEWIEDLMQKVQNNVIASIQPDKDIFITIENTKP